MMIAPALKLLMRRKRPVVFTDLRRVEPVSTLFGLDRGTAIDRHYIERFLSRHADDIRGHALEIGDSEYSRRFGGRKVVAYEVFHATAENPAATIIGDLTDPQTLPSDTFDCF